MGKSFQLKMSYKEYLAHYLKSIGLAIFLLVIVIDVRVFTSDWINKQEIGLTVAIIFPFLIIAGTFYNFYSKSKNKIYFQC
jgi:hypothetical protein